MVSSLADLRTRKVYKAAPRDAVNDLELVCEMVGNLNLRLAPDISNIDKQAGFIREVLDALLGFFRRKAPGAAAVSRGKTALTAAFKAIDAAWKENPTSVTMDSLDDVMPYRFALPYAQQAALTKMVRDLVTLKGGAVKKMPPSTASSSKSGPSPSSASAEASVSVMSLFGKQRG